MQLATSSALADIRDWVAADAIRSMSARTKIGSVELRWIRLPECVTNARADAHRDESTIVMWNHEGHPQTEALSFHGALTVQCPIQQAVRFQPSFSHQNTSNRRAQTACAQGHITIHTQEKELSVLGAAGKAPICCSCFKSPSHLRSARSFMTMVSDHIPLYRRPH